MLIADMIDIFDRLAPYISENLLRCALLPTGDDLLPRSYTHVDRMYADTP